MRGPGGAVLGDGYIDQANTGTRPTATGDLANDLTDADVEVVPMKSRPARVLPMDNPPVKKSWEELSERIMKATAL